MSEQEWDGLIRLPVMLPDGSIAIFWFPATEPLPETFTLELRPDGAYDIIVPQVRELLT
jgi:hypothetical protein